MAPFFDDRRGAADLQDGAAAPAPPAPWPVRAARRAPSPGDALLRLRAALGTRRPAPAAAAALAAELAGGIAAAIPARAVVAVRLSGGVRPPPAARLLAVGPGAESGAGLAESRTLLPDIEAGLGAPAGPCGLPTLDTAHGRLTIAAVLRDGEDGVALAAVDAARDAARDPALGDGLAALARAFDDHLRACDAIAASDRQRQMDEAIEALDDGFIACDPRLRVFAANRRFADHFPELAALGPLRGRTLRELAARSVAAGRMTADHADAALRALIRGDAPADGSLVAAIGARKVMIRDFPTASGGLVGLRTDVTAIVEREEALRRALEAAEAASRDKTAFLAQMSHELRTPLNAIIGFSEMMAGEILGPLGGERYRGYAEDIRTCAGHLLALINDLLDMSRIERGVLRLELGQFDLAEVVGEATRMLQATASAKLTLAEDRAPGPLPTAGDRRATLQIVMNLLSNAIKFTPPGGRVTVRTGRAGAAVVVSVEDTGMGISRADIERIGRPFERSTDAVRLGLPGTGLGLAISMALARLQGGALALESRPGEGTTATLTLPAAGDAPGAAPAAPG